METRQTQKRSKKRFSPASELTLSDDIIRHFHENGYRLRWVRYLLEGLDDTRNISNYVREGYSWVTRQEITKALGEDVSHGYATTKINNNNQVICQGDLILGKIQTDDALAREEYYQDRANDQLMAASGEAVNAQNAQMDKLTPIEDDSRSSLTTRIRKDSDD